jgi:hypothetical protein
MRKKPVSCTQVDRLLQPVSAPADPLCLPAFAAAMEDDDEDFFAEFGVGDLDEDEGAPAPAKKAPAKPTFTNSGDGLASTAGDAADPAVQAQPAYGTAAACVFSCKCCSHE